MKKTKKDFQMNDDYNMPEYHIPEPMTELIEALNRSALALSEHDATSLSEQVDEVIQGLSGTRAGGQVYLIEPRMLEPYPDQPFRPYPRERLEELAEDIGRVGILSPILARRLGNRLQVLAGHNRLAAAKLAGLSEVPVLLMEADDDQAALVVTGTNLRQRERLLPSEKAFAYKIQMDALKRQGQRVGGTYTAAGFITEQTGDSRMQIHRYIRLCELQRGLLELLDRAKLSLTAAVAVSYLKPEDQAVVFELVRDFRASLTADRADTLKKLAADGGTLGREQIARVLLVPTVSKRPEGELRLSYDRLREYLPPDVSGEDAERIIIEALRAYGKVRA